MPSFAALCSQRVAITLRNVGNGLQVGKLYYPTGLISSYLLL